MDIFDLLNMIGGLALFLYGMHVLGEGLAKIAGGRLEGILEKLTKNPFMAVLLGAGVTAVIQSSSATTVMVVGFVNSGIMKLNQAVGIIMGANIGTTVTSWILSLTGIQGDNLLVQLLKPTSFSPVLAMIGIILLMDKKEGSKKKNIGEILLGFSVLMFGMDAMSTAVSGLADNPSFTGLMTKFQNPLLGMAMGAILTAIIQSSSASVGILQALCATGAIHYAVALPIIMGQNIGTCVTSIISSIGANKNARRAAMVHLYFNLIGTVIFMTVFYSINAFLQFSFLEESANAAGIAVIHSLFNIGATLVLFPFSKGLVKLAELTVRDKKDEGTEMQKSTNIMLDERFLEKPSFAMEVSRNQVKEMAKAAEESIRLALEVLISYDKKKAKEVTRLEKLVDQYEDALGTYLVQLSGKNLSQKDSQSFSIILHSISDFERISDHSLDIVKAAEKMKKKDLSFTKGEKRELQTLCRAVSDICDMTVESFCGNDTAVAKNVEPLEEVIDTLIKKVKKNHLKRLQKGKCGIEIGFVLEDVLIALERVSDHCSNVALELITIGDNEYNTHEFFKNFSDNEQRQFEKAYKKLLKQYPLGKGDVIMDS